MKRRAMAAWLGLNVTLLAGCASPARAPAARDGQSWSGRLALAVMGQQNQSFSAGFELRGAPETGELTLSNPLGGTLALLAWAPGRATLRSGNDLREFPSLEALAQEATGAPIPIAALFDWLRGVATPVPGWAADVSRVGEGRLHAQRKDPGPLVDLRLVFGD